MFQDKVRKYFPNESDDEVKRLAFELSNHAEIVKKFKHLVSYTSEVVKDMQEENELLSGLHSLERDKLHERAKQGVVSVCHLPVKLRLSKLQQTWALSHSFTSLLRFEYGPLHAALEVGNITIQWGRESLVVPSYEPSATYFSAHVHDQGEWFDETYKLVKDMSLADRCKDRTRRIEILNNSIEKKEQLLSKLADVIINYNLNKTYNVYSCNCQTFVLDALAALGIKEPPEFTGRLNEYFQALKTGRSLKNEFHTHEELDRHVERRISILTSHEAEYLLCQYFKFHLPSIEEAEDEEHWECNVPNCRFKALEVWLKDHTLLLNQFLKEGTAQVHTVSRPPAVLSIPEETDEETEPPDYMQLVPYTASTQANLGSNQLNTAPTQAKGVQNQPNGGSNGIANNTKNGVQGPQHLNAGVVGEVEEDPDARLAREKAGDTNQEELLARYVNSGYSKRIADKVSRKFPDKSERERTELGEMLTSVECVRAKYFSGFIEGTTEPLALEASADYKRFQKNQLPRSEARRQSIDRLQTASNLSMKLVLRAHTQSVQGHGSILDTPLQAYLLFENLIFQWNESSLVVPNKAHTLLGSQPTYKASLHLNEWCAFVDKQESRKQAATENINGEVEIELIYDFTKKRDTLVLSLIRVIVDYNRNKWYDSRRCNNQHFIHDVCRAVGIKVPPEICPTIKQQLLKLKPSQSVRRAFPKRRDLNKLTHQDLDTFVKGEIQNDRVASYKSDELNFLIGQYFRLHLTSWDEARRPQGQWRCEVDDCQLEELERHKPPCESDWCVLL